MIENRYLVLTECGVVYENEWCPVLRMWVRKRRGSVSSVPES